MAPDIPPAFQGVKALVFDVFGTVVDWRSTVHEELTRRAREKLDASAGGGSLPEPARERLRAMTERDDWAAFAEQWRASYGRFVRSFDPATMPWKDIDTHHRESLVELLGASGIGGGDTESGGGGGDGGAQATSVFTAAEIDDLSLVWHRLRAWDDSVEGLRRLGSRFATATLSNGNRAILEDLDGSQGLGFRLLVSAEDFGAYKPHPSTYLGVAEKLGVRPEECALVAAHLYDLKAARGHGFRTIYVERPREEEEFPVEFIREAQRWVDMWVAESEGGLVEVAERLGISG